jgi:hypothetical protein
VPTTPKVMPPRPSRFGMIEAIAEPLGKTPSVLSPRTDTLSFASKLPR